MERGGKVFIKVPQSQRKGGNIKRFRKEIVKKKKGIIIIRRLCLFSNYLSNKYKNTKKIRIHKLIHSLVVLLKPKNCPK